MFTERENLLRTIKGDSPDRLVNEYSPFAFAMGDPVGKYVRGIHGRGESFVDRWGVNYHWPEDAPGLMPYITEATKVCRDITRWKDYVKVPDIEANATDWTAVKTAAASVDRNEQFVTSLMATGMFEQAHFLMGFEDALCSLITEPDYMHELLDAILEYRMTYARLICENLKPDAVLSHDDWGAKNRLFMSPELWREFFKPRYAKFYGYLHSQGIMVVHHADSYLADIIEDMVDIGVDIWQGVLPQNDIPKLQIILKGRMALMGGIDAAVVDRADSTEAEIRAEARKACMEYATKGYFIPCLTYGLPGGIYKHVTPIIKDEIDRCSKEIFGK